jgi:hypothetical protein
MESPVPIVGLWRICQQFWANNLSATFREHLSIEQPDPGLS